MKKQILASVMLAVMLAPTAVFAEGYGLIEYTTEGVAMGGAAMFIENDAGNLAYNPAGITLCEGEQFKFSATYISPHGNSMSQSKITRQWQNEGDNRIHPAWVPGAYYVRKVGDREWYAIGCFSRFGNKSEFEPGSMAATNNRYAYMKGLSITPTYARRTGRKFYWALGADINYVGLELQKNFDYYTAAGYPALTGNNRTEGETWALGWNAGLRYAPTKKDEIGFAYRSKIAHTMDADFEWYGASVMGLLPGPMDIRTGIHGKVTLPDSYHLGYSHRFDRKNRVEVSTIRTQWHNFRTLDMTMDAPYTAFSPSSVHNWKDNWRYAIGYEHKFSEKYTGMIGFSYDEDCIPYDGGDFMVPTGCRRTYSIGAKYHDRQHTIAFTLGWMDLGNNSYKSNYQTDGYISSFAYNNIAKIFSVGYTYHF